jgi:hypothetical protein
MSAAPTWFIVVIALAAVHFAMREAILERASVRKARISFPPVYSLRAMFWLGIPAFSFAAYKVAAQLQSAVDWIYPTLYVGLVLLAFFSVPGTINLDNEGISIKKFLGLRVKRLLWREVTSVAPSTANKTITVYGPDGTSIIHTRFHVDPQRFLLELRKHVKVD